jgi:hypothetical protein
VEGLGRPLALVIAPTLRLISPVAPSASLRADWERECPLSRPRAAKARRFVLVDSSHALEGITSRGHTQLSARPATELAKSHLARSVYGKRAPATLGVLQVPKSIRLLTRCLPAQAPQSSALPKVLIFLALPRGGRLAGSKAIVNHCNKEHFTAAKTAAKYCR